MINYLILPFIGKVTQNQQAFGEKIIATADSLDISPNWLMIVINNESAGTFSASVKNPTSSATGLIQFMAATAEGLGTSVGKLSQMSNVDQLNYVKAYLMPYKGQMKSAADVYLAVFFPAALKQPDTWEFPDWASKANRIFDLNKDGVLTKAEFTQYVNDKYAPYLKGPLEYVYGKKKLS